MSPIIGFGHFMRCFNLAKSLIESGSKVTFLSRNLESNLSNRIIAAGCCVIDLPRLNNLSYQSPDDYATWLGANEQNDISQCLDLVSRDEDFNIIVDHYGVNVEWLGIAKKVCRKLIVIDDLAERRMDVDIVLNPNLGWTVGDYAHLIGKKTKLLLGPQYALLAENYATARHKLDRSFRSEATLRVLVSLGGADIENVSGKVARVLERMLTKQGFIVTIVVGPMNPNSKELDEISQRSDGKIVLMQGANNLSDAYASHDIAIGAVGGSSWERCCLGLPTILVPIAENQKPAAKNLRDAGAGILVDYGSDRFEAELSDGLTQLFNNELRQAISQRARDICDGKGISRVCNEVLRPH